MGLPERANQDSGSDSESTVRQNSGPNSVNFERDDKIDWNAYYEQNAGKNLIVDPEEARAEFGEAAASTLKLSSDGTKILWPQPSDSPLDPQNWSERKKAFHMLVIILAAIVPDFDNGIGITTVFAMAQDFGTTPEQLNKTTAKGVGSSSWALFVIGFGAFFSVWLINRYGRLPVMFWSQILALVFLIGCTWSDSVGMFGAFRCLCAFFGAAPQITGLYIISDMYPFHLQAKMVCPTVGIWTMGFIMAVFLSPFGEDTQHSPISKPDKKIAFGFLVAHNSWRWAYGIGSMYGGVVCVLIAFCTETLFDRRTNSNIPLPRTGLRYRLETLVGITALRLAKYRASWKKAILPTFNLMWRPHMFGMMVFINVVLGFGIGMTLTNAVFLGAPPPVGFGWSITGVSGGYATPLVATAIGTVFTKFGNDWILAYSLRRNKGVFVPEDRLWICYPAVVLYIAGFILLGYALEQRMHTVAVVFGWGIAATAQMMATAQIYAYCNDSFSTLQGEVSGLLNLARSLGGFAVAWYQIPWVMAYGAEQTFGCEAAIVVGVFLIVVPALQWKGKFLRTKFAIY
ncbi:hypothetical protein AAF712_012888 [Marasmius tenuissimus]|uniref:MFS general substrate transporter n=1 Tax=Marasmius tenuissimus TaxID=585030 RepID=A0ABR2ZGG0_9AGAR